VVNNNAEQEKLIKTMEKKTRKQEKEIRNLRKDIESFKGQVIEFEASAQCLFLNAFLKYYHLDQGKGPC
jgi:hypothetical protein